VQNETVNVDAIVPFFTNTEMLRIAPIKGDICHVFEDDSRDLLDSLHKK
jgi:hypothetical protein